MGNDPYMPLWNMMFGIAAAGAIVIFAILIFKLVIFVGEKIQDRIEQRRHKSPTTSQGIMSPNEYRRMQGLETWAIPFCHILGKKHSYKLVSQSWQLRYRFKCQKCGHISFQDKGEFWGTA